MKSNAQTNQGGAAVKRMFGARKRLFGSTEDAISHRSSISSRNDLPKKLDPIELIRENIFTRERCRMKEINKARDEFGIYSDSIGYTRKTIFFAENEKGTLSLRYSPDGEKVVAGFGSGTIKVFDMKSYTLLKIIRVGKENGYATTCIRFLPKSNDIFYASSTEGTVVCYNSTVDDLNVIISQKNREINSFDINCNATKLVTGGSYQDVKLYDVNTNRLVQSFKNKRERSCSFELSFTEFHTNRVQAVKFHPDDRNIFLSGGWDKLLKVWDTRTKFGCVRTKVGPFISGDAIDIRGSHILTGSWEPSNTVKIWDFRNFSLIQDVYMRNNVTTDGIYTFAVAYFDNDRTSDLILHASLGYKSLDIISVKENIVIYSIFCNKSTVCIDSHGPHIVCGGTNNAIYYIDFFMNLLVNFRDRPVFLEKQKTMLKYNT